LFGNLGRVEKEKFEIKEIIEDMGMVNMFFKKIFCVNCNSPEDKELSKLRETILKYSKGQIHWGQPMPSKCLLLEDKLMKERKNRNRVMTLKEDVDLNMKSPFALDQHEELPLFLKIHHDIGTLMYFADEGLNDLVILEAQWLADSLKTIITAQRFRDQRYRKEWDILHKKGIVYKEFIESVWRDFKSERFYEFKDHLIQLMTRMDLLSRPRQYNDKGNHIIAPYFIVPCMLKSAPDGFLQQYHENATHSNQPLGFEFEYSFLPMSTAYRLLATCIVEYGESDQSKINIYCDAAVFKVYPQHYLTLEFTSSSVIANILTFEKLYADVGVCQGVREFIDDTLKCITTSQKTSINYSLSVGCDKNNAETQKWLPWDELQEKPAMICEHNPPHVVKTDMILKQWLKLKVSDQTA